MADSMPPVKRQKVEIFIVTDLILNSPPKIDKKDISIVNGLA